MWQSEFVIVELSYRNCKFFIERTELNEFYWIEIAITRNEGAVRKIRRKFGDQFEVVVEPPKTKLKTFWFFEEKLMKSKLPNQMMAVQFSFVSDQPHSRTLATNCIWR